MYTTGETARSYGKWIVIVGVAYLIFGIGMHIFLPNQHRYRWLRMLREIMLVGILFLLSGCILIGLGGIIMSRSSICSNCDVQCIINTDTNIENA